MRQRLLVLTLAFASSALISATPAPTPLAQHHGYRGSDGGWVEIRPWYADGTLLQGSEIQVYVVLNRVRHCIPDPATFQAMGYDRKAVTHVTDDDLAAVPEGKPLASLGFD